MPRIALPGQEAEQQAREFAAGLLALGVLPEHCVAIAATTRLEWILADLAVTLAGAATTTVYLSTSPVDADEIVGDCRAVVVCAQNAAQLGKLRSNDGFILCVKHPGYLGSESFDLCRRLLFRNKFAVSVSASRLRSVGAHAQRRPTGAVRLRWSVAKPPEAMSQVASTKLPYLRISARHRRAVQLSISGARSSPVLG